MDIRPIRPSDEPALRALCLETTPLRRREQSERFVIWTAFGQYYLDCEAANSFIAEEGGAPAGAVLCAPDYADYLRRFTDRVYPKCKPYGYLAGATARQTSLLHQKFAGRYPGHMQCLWPAARPDLAQPLFEALAARLEALECRGVCVFPSRKQQALWQSLQALGFGVLGKSGQILIMGKELF
ncbi:MAG: hypothetical protein LBB75_09315 [Oscillospiraceae bacterium]|jgi:hypothetical protein|nr:hypothetical protein [Oscillospiraceae bacterium]